MAQTAYRVVGAAALLTQDSLQGPIRTTLYKGAPVGPGMTDAEITHNLAMGLIEAVGGSAPMQSPITESNAEPADDGDADDEEPSGDEEAAQKAAAAKLPEDGAAPDGRASKATWVEHGVRKGYDRASLEAEDKHTIVALLKEG